MKKCEGEEKEKDNELWREPVYLSQHIIIFMYTSCAYSSVL